MNRIEPDNSAGNLGALEDMWNSGPPHEYADLDSGVVAEYFTRGQCHAFAIAVHELTGWPVYVSGIGWQGDPMQDGNHAWVMRPDGMIIDINGEQDASDFLEGWGHDYTHEVESLPEDFYDSGWFQFDMETARTWAPRLLATV